MKTVILVFLVVLAAAAAVPKSPQRIVGGSTTTINNYPSMSALLYSSNLVTFWQSCGGAVINNRSILTASHCVYGDKANNWRIRVGSTYASSGGSLFNVNRIVMHPSYNSRTNDNDVAVMQASGTFSFGSSISAAGIAGSNYNLGDNQVVYAAGWGTVSYGGQQSEQLRHVQIWTVNQNTCKTRYGSAGISITDNMLCSGWLDVGGRDQCQGDSGGPLYHNNVVVGVCSFGIGCAQAYYPGVNARVSKFASWIQSNA